MFLTVCDAREGYALFWCIARVDFALFYMSRERITRLFECVARTGSARFVRKIFARKKTLSGKFLVFGPLPGDPCLLVLRLKLYIDFLFHWWTLLSSRQCTDSITICPDPSSTITCHDYSHQVRPKIHATGYGLELCSKWSKTDKTTSSCDLKLSTNQFWGKIATRLLLV